GRLWRPATRGWRTGRAGVRAAASRAAAHPPPRRQREGRGPPMTRPEDVTSPPHHKEGPVQFDHVAQQVPDIAAAVEWQRATVPGTTVVYQDHTWALVESAGVRIAFVLPDQHPNHLAYRV